LIPPIKERLIFLKATQIFESFDNSALESIAIHMEEASYQPGQIVVREGEEADKFFMIIGGRAEISTNDTGNQLILATLEKGEVFGEIALLSSEHKRQATVTAIDKLHLLYLDGAVINGLIAKYPGILCTLQAISDIRIKTKFLKQFSPFKFLPPERLKLLISKLEKVSVETGATIINQGEIGQECYLILSGKMEVLIQENRQSLRKIATLYPGCILGEASLLTEEPRNATVRAVEPCELLSIKRTILLEIMREDNQLDTNLLAIQRQRDRPCRIGSVIVQEQRSCEGDMLKILKNPQIGTYIRLSAEGWFIWERLDGQHTLKDLTLDFMSEWKTLAPDKIAAIIAELSKSGFIQTKSLRYDVLPVVAKISWWQRIQQMARHVMELNLVWKNPDPFFSFLYRRTGKFLFSKTVKMLLALLSLSGLVLFFLLGNHVSPILQDQSRSRPLLFILIPALITALVLHEIGHAITTKHYNKEVRGAGIGWYWFSPVAFVDTTDMWTAEKWPRIAVSVAGPYTNIILAAFATFVAWVSPSIILSAALWQFALISYINVLMNFNPLLEYDGYYILSDLMGRPNLRRRSLAWLGRYLRGTNQNPHELGGHWFEFFYGIFSIIYVVFMAYIFVVSYRLVLEVHFKSILPEIISSWLPWLIAFIIVFSAGILILGEMKLFEKRSS
jgi:putative peptide zinc metalloprotease protein